MVEVVGYAVLRLSHSKFAAGYVGVLWWIRCSLGLEESQGGSTSEAQAVNEARQKRHASLAAGLMQETERH